MASDTSMEGSVRATVYEQNTSLLDWVAQGFGIGTPVSRDPKAATQAINILLGRIRAVGLPEDFFSRNPWERDSHAEHSILEFAISALNDSAAPGQTVSATTSTPAKRRGRPPGKRLVAESVPGVYSDSAPASSEESELPAISETNGYAPEEIDEHFSDEAEAPSPLQSLGSLFG